MLKQALALAQDWVGKVPGVIMVGEGRNEKGEPTIEVWASQPVDLPTSVMGVQVRVRESGEIEAQ